METLIVAGVISAVLYIVYSMTRRARADAVVSELIVQPKVEEIAEAKEVAKLEQEIVDAKIDYRTARDIYNKRVTDSQRPAEVPSAPKSPTGSVQPSPE